MKVAILFPNTTASLALAVQLIERGHSVSIYCPNEVDIEAAKYLIPELTLVGLKQERMRGGKNFFSVLRVPIFSEFQILGNNRQHLFFVKNSWNTLKIQPIRRKQGKLRLNFPTRFAQSKF